MDFGFDPTVVFSSLLARRLRRGPIDRVKQLTRRKRLQQISDAACRQRLPAHHLTIDGGHEQWPEPANRL